MRRSESIRWIVIGLTLLLYLFSINNIVSAQDSDILPLRERDPDVVVSKGWSFDTSYADDFWTSFLLRNSGNKLAKISVMAYDAEGNSLGTIKTYAIAAGKTKVISSANIEGELPAGTAEIKIVSDQAINAAGIMGLLNDNWTTTLQGISDEAISCQAESSTPDILKGSIEPQGSSSCCGYSSPGNICIYCPSCTNKGNCVWWTWKEAKDIWGQSLPWCTNAKTWADKARQYGWPVNTTPAPNTICVNSTYGGYGHVAWVESVDGSYVNVSEMNYCLTCKQNKRYTKTFCDKGFIYKK